MGKALTSAFPGCSLCFCTLLLKGGVDFVTLPKILKVLVLGFFWERDFGLGGFR